MMNWKDVVFKRKDKYVYYGIKKQGAFIVGCTKCIMTLAAYVRDDGAVVLKSKKMGNAIEEVADLVNLEKVKNERRRIRKRGDTMRSPH